MSGHSKWSTIKHKKGKLDAQRGKIFTKVIREIQSAVRTGGSGEAESNPRLRMALAKAKDVNMPADNIKRAIQKALGGDDGSALEELTYEGYGPGGVAIMVSCLTDNKNRTLPIIRNALTKNGGNMGNAGCVSYLFTQKGQIFFAPGVSEDKVMEIAIEAGADDVQSSEDGSIEVLCDPADIEAVRQAFDDAKLHYEQAEVTMLAATTVALEEEDAIKVLKIIETLENEDDVQNVYSNSEISDEIMEKIEGS